MPKQTEETHLGLIRYWRACLVDAGLGKSCFEENDFEGTQAVNLSELKTGRLRNNTIEYLFKKLGQEEEETQVHFWPMLVVRSSSHSIPYMDNLPNHVAPIVSSARVSKDGRVWPERTVIGRDILEPVGKGIFSVGSVEKLDTFLMSKSHPASSEDNCHEQVWEEYIEFCKELREAVVEGWPDSDDTYERRNEGMIALADNTLWTVKNIIALYDHILETSPIPPLLQNYARIDPSTVVPYFNAPHKFAGCLGHSTDAFPLNDGQRDALAHLAAAREGEILAVNGPPGTGKTTMLLSAIADEWVRAARAGGDPPVITATSSNNRAITNIIDAFAKDFAHGDGPFAGRWLPKINSFGLYLPAPSKQKYAEENGYQTKSFFEERETEEYLHTAKVNYLKHAAAALPELTRYDVRTVIKALRKRINSEANRLEAVDAARQRLAAARVEVADALGADPEPALTELEAQRKQCEHEDEKNRALFNGWKAYLAQEPILLALFSILPPVADKRRRRARQFLEEIGYDPGPDLKIDAIETELHRRTNAGSEQLLTATASVARGRSALDELQCAREAFAGAARDIGVSDCNQENVTDQERQVDIGVRFRLFLLATHYWEGRWLIETYCQLPNITEQRQKKDGWLLQRDELSSRLRRWMMLTPCMVATLFRLPREVKFWTPGRNGYLFNFIDLLIVDEAGQASPDVAGAAFSLAKKALVIGDTHQLAPIPQIPKFIDIGNLTGNRLLPEQHTEKDLKRIEEAGLTSSGGSVMRVAQYACHYYPEPELDRGLWLFEHRRCYDEIVAYCNELSYKGRLEPRRGSALEYGPKGQGAIPGPLAYLHVNGRCLKSERSRLNEFEARTVAAWLADVRPDLETAYGKRLEQIVGVVTPFARQARAIKTACEQAEIRVDSQDGMTIGTIHALQGADRDVVIFSPTYSKHENGGFIDASASMLNVAVSRAKDAFLVIGDMDLFETANPGSPRRLLGSFLSPENAIEFEVQQRDDLEPHEHKIWRLQNAQEHDNFLLELLGSNGTRKITIVSPWIVVSTIKQTGILSALREARQRGVEIDVYVDSKLNCKTNLDQAQHTLEEIGVSLKYVEKVHSKIILVDERLLSIGSFNWLSAARYGQYARQETSFVYQGPHLSDEIKVITKSLNQRVIADAD